MCNNVFAFRFLQIHKPSFHLAPPNVHFLSLFAATYVSPSCFHNR